MKNHHKRIYYISNNTGLVPLFEYYTVTINHIYSVTKRLCASEWNGFILSKCSNP